MPIAKRDRMVARFQLSYDDGSRSAFKAFGWGSIMGTVKHLSHVDRWWNPVVDDHATSRTVSDRSETKRLSRHFLSVATITETGDLRQ